MKTVAKIQALYVTLALLVANLVLAEDLGRPRPAYMIAGMTQSADPMTVDPIGYQQYVDIVREAMASVGGRFETIGSGAGDSLRIVAGSYEPGILVIARFDSMQGLINFWNSPEYERGKRVRHGFAYQEVAFILAVEGVPSEREPGVVAGAYGLAVGGKNTDKRGSMLADAGPSDMQVLEGQWPYQGKLRIRSYPSLEEAAQATAAIAGTLAIVVPGTASDDSSGSPAE